VRVSQSTPFLVESHHPATFRSRGVVAPFTTPLLTGTRVRESKSSGIELVVPNPSGGRGVYILDWGGVRALGGPTVHDSVLFRQLAKIGRLDPCSMRDAALIVAKDGLAGRDGVATAKRCLARDAAHRLQAHFLLMIALIEQVSPTSMKIKSLADHAATVERQGSLTLQQIAPQIGRSPADLADALAAMGDAFAPVGVAPESTDSRIAALLARMEYAHESLSDWLHRDPQNDAGGFGRAVAAAMQTAINYGYSLMVSTRTALADPLGLLKRWVKDPEDVIGLAGRPSWVLDGWEWICLLWLIAQDDQTRHRALVEMAQLVPVLPGETSAWNDTPPPPEALRTPFRVTSRDDAWRSGGTAFALIGRNETVRAMST
jgi:hypothetical protein